MEADASSRHVGLEQYRSAIPPRYRPLPTDCWIVDFSFPFLGNPIPGSSRRDRNRDVDELDLCRSCRCRSYLVGLTWARISRRITLPALTLAKDLRRDRAWDWPWDRRGIAGLVDEEGEGGARYAGKDEWASVAVIWRAGRSIYASRHATETSGDIPGIPPPGPTDRR